MAIFTIFWGLSLSFACAQSNFSPLNIAGDWFDAQLSTSQIRILQSGGDFSFTSSAVGEDQPLAGIRVDSSGTGRTLGNSLSVDYTARAQNGGSVNGHCSGVLRKEDVIAWHCKDANGADFRTTWIKR